MAVVPRARRLVLESSGRQRAAAALVVLAAGSVPVTVSARVCSPGPMGLAGAVNGPLADVCSEPEPVIPGGAGVRLPAS